MNKRLAYVLSGLFVLSFFAVSGHAGTPGPYDITVQANEDYRLNLTHTANGRPINLTGYQFKLQAKKAAADSAAFVTFSSAVTDPLLGKTSHWLHRGTTAANVRATGIYDLMQIAPDGTVTYKVKGTIKFMETVTR